MRCSVGLLILATCCVGMIAAYNQQKRGLMEFESRDGLLLAKAPGGKNPDKWFDFKFKGINWFGFDTATNVFHGLWGKTNTDHIFRVLKEHNFNGLRVPFGAQAVLDNTAILSRHVKSDPELDGKTVLEAMSIVFAKAAAYDILIVLDYQMVTPTVRDGKKIVSGGIPENWYTDDFGKDKVKQTWSVLASWFCKDIHWNVMAADIKNEPHGRANWGYDNHWDWVVGAEELGNHVLSKCPRWLIFVEGTDANVKKRDKYITYWGARLDGNWYESQWVHIDDDKRLVYSPHAYGPSVFKMKYHDYNKGFPTNQLDIWYNEFAFVPEKTGRALVVGEWGGKYQGMDIAYQNTFMAFLRKWKFGSFYWCVNPNSYDTYGYFQDDWRKTVWEKVNLMSKLPYTSLACMYDNVNCDEYN